MFFNYQFFVIDIFLSLLWKWWCNGYFHINDSWVMLHIEMLYKNCHFRQSKKYKMHYSQWNPYLSIHIETLHWHILSYQYQRNIQVTKYLSQSLTVQSIITILIKHYTVRRKCSSILKIWEYFNIFFTNLCTFLIMYMHDFRLYPTLPFKLYVYKTNLQEHSLVNVDHN